MNYSKGISWFDDCRIPFVEADSNINFDRPRTRKSVNDEWVLKQAHDYTDPQYKEYNQQGRFPANLLCSDDMLNDGIIYKSGDGKSGMKLINHNKNNFAVGEEMTFTKKGKTIHYGDKGSNSRYYDIDKWFDKMINEL